MTRCFPIKNVALSPSSQNMLKCKSAALGGVWFFSSLAFYFRTLEYSPRKGPQRLSRRLPPVTDNNNQSFLLLRALHEMLFTDDYRDSNRD